MEVKEVLTLVDAAKICNVSHMTMWRWAKQGKIKTFKTLGGHHRVLWTDMIKFLEENGMDHLPERVKPRKKKVLFISDPLVGAEELVQKLRETGFLIEWATEGFEAGRTFSAFNPDCVVLNFSTPGINGPLICKTLKYDPATSPVKIIVLSDNNIHKEEALEEIGADILLPLSDNYSLLYKKILSICR
ncbi:MAG TPA: response regulator [Deltaproteobacteria bacterium]|nr:response regulator [Deltaproteobacteria bacterium]